MTNTGVFKAANEAMSLKDLTPMTRENFIATTKGMTYDIAVKSIEKLGLDVNKVMVTTKGLSNYWYVDGHVKIQLVALVEDWLKMTTSHLESIKQEVNEMISNKEFKRLFRVYANGFQFDMFMDLYDQIPEADKYPVFKNIYINAEYGFNELPKSHIEEVFKLNERKDFKETLKNDLDDKGFLTIYRGAGDLSSDVHTGYSWSTNLSTALFFACRFNSKNPSVYTAKVHIDDVVDFITSRGESEILVLPRTLKDVSEMDFYKSAESMLTPEMVSEYLRLQSYIKDEWFFNPEGIHGPTHIRRVIILSILLTELLKLPYLDKQIIKLCALTHDIGRVNDLRDDLHGKRSAEKLDKIGRVVSKFNLSEKELKIARFIIEHHSLSDNEGKDAIMDSDFEDKERIEKLLFIFKDTDNLDRVRLNDLDINYLRNSESKKLLIVAWEMYFNLK